MSVRKLQVFLASRFGEFREERTALAARLNAVKELAVEAIDLNDNFPSERPPIERCYEAVDRAEVFVLLVGMTYGEGVHRPDSESYTHLEYRRALEDRSKIILPYVIGSIEEVTTRNGCDPRLRAWLQEISKKQCASRLDPALDPQRNASNIFEVVLSRLWEINIGAATPDEDGDDDDTSSPWEDSPIKREELTDYAEIAAERKTPPLRFLAANHVKEALDALQWKLPQIAIHHLRAAVEPVPLDVVLSYWLARLLIATGRRVECAQGRTIAVRCARIAARQDNELRQMVALILVARANERLGERTLSMVSAEAAHGVMPHHWFAKLELGRQDALAGQNAKASERAEEAFWLRPESIRQIERDDAYRGLGPDFDAFRDDLHARVRAETDAVFDVELAVVEYERELLASDTKFAPGDAFADLLNRESLSSRKLVSRARGAARHTLDLLQRCAKRIITDANAFESHGFRRLRQETLDAIEQKRQAERKEISDAAMRAKNAGETSARASTRLQMVALIGFTIFLSLILSASMQRNSDWNIGLLFSAAGVAIGAGIFALRIAWPRYSVSRDDSRAASAAETRASKALKADDEAAASFHSAVGVLRERIVRFATLVHRFEKSAARRLPIAPAGTMFREKHAGDLVRLDGKEEHVRLETDLLPADLKFITGDGFTPRAKHWFARYMGRGDPDVYSRSAAYFSVSTNSSER